MHADQLTLELDNDAPRRCMKRLVMPSSLPRMERFHAMPDGWKLDRSWGSPEYGWQPICNGKSMINGGRKGLLKVEKQAVKESLTPASKQIEPEPERVELTTDEVKIAAKAMNDLARAKFKRTLLQDLMVDLMVCKIEGWSIEEYISDLKTLIDETASSILHNVQAHPRREENPEIEEKCCPPLDAAPCSASSDPPGTDWHAAYLKASDRAIQMETESSEHKRELSEAKAMLQIVSEMMRHTDSCYESALGCICGVAKMWKDAKKIFSPTPTATIQAATPGFAALSGKLVGFDCREKTLTFDMEEMPLTGTLGESGLIYLPNAIVVAPGSAVQKPELENELDR